MESSAVVKLLVEEGESDRLSGYLNGAVERDEALVSCLLLETELRRFAVRTGVPQGTVSGVLRRFDIIELDRSAFREAGLLPGSNLRSLDALHVAAALRAEADLMLTYDRRQAVAAEAAGLAVLAP